ncbi:MAG: DUF5678 domain-containing protein [Chloroflexota bacterium]
MSKKVTLDLPEQTWAEAKKLAAERQMSIESLLIEQLQSGFDHETESDSAVAREKQAWLKLHPQLVETHLGQHVAVANEQVVDFDDNRLSLMQRINKSYPDQFVWVALVREKPIRTIHTRSGYLKD